MYHKGSKVKPKSVDQSVLPILRSAVGNLIHNKVILFPFCVIAFIQVFILEIFYFAPRVPLKAFFGPVIRTLWNEQYLHYPYNLLIVPKLFQYAQVPIYIFISSFFIATAISIIVTINSDKKVQYKKILKETFTKSYIHIIIASGISYFFIKSGYTLYQLAYARADLIRSQSGLFYILKRLVIDGAPYFIFFMSIIVTTAFAYVIPIIVIEKKKVFSAIGLNFKKLFQSLLSTFLIVAIPSLFYLPVLLLRNSLNIEEFFPEMIILGLLLSIFSIIFIDAVVYTSLTIFYLLKRESRQKK